MAATVAPTRATLRKAFEARMAARRPALVAAASTSAAARGAGRALPRARSRASRRSRGSRSGSTSARRASISSSLTIRLPFSSRRGAAGPAAAVAAGGSRDGSRRRGVPVGRRCRRPTGKDGRPCARPDEGDGAGERGRVREKCVRLVGAGGLGPGPGAQVARRAGEVRGHRLVGGGDVLGRGGRVEPEARQELALQLLGARELACGGRRGHRAAPAGRASAARARALVIRVALVSWPGSMPGL